MSEKPQRGGSSKGEGGSKLFGIILIIAGAFIAIIGVLNLLGINPLTSLFPPEWAFLAGISGWMNIVIGVWGFIGGVGLTKSQEWGYHRRCYLLLPYGGSPLSFSPL